MFYSVMSILNETNVCIILGMLRRKEKEKKTLDAFTIVHYNVFSSSKTWKM